jgi:hypothetical protein
MLSGRLSTQSYSKMDFNQCEIDTNGSEWEISNQHAAKFESSCTSTLKNSFREKRTENKDVNIPSTTNPKNMEDTTLFTTKQHDIVYPSTQESTQDSFINTTTFVVALLTYF